MKNVIFISAALTALFSINANAQATGQATLNVNIYPIQTITVNTSQKNVNLDYKTVADYANGVNLDQADHLKIYSTGAFTVSVNSSTDFLTNADAKIDDKIKSSDITITATKGSTNELVGATFTPATLGAAAATLITSDKGGNDKTFNINYKATGGSDAYINLYHKDQSPTVYTTNVVYTIAAK
ncbi:hypothetical protein [Kaistella sp.]|uniref:hypothetical protein n=1 Tax=Kaistella sp. TaxID=2782235 RepID=UPI003C47BAD1